MTIHELPFKDFRKIVITGDLGALQVDQWEAILEQYADAIGDTNTDSFVATRRELMYYQTQRYLVDLYVKLLSANYVKKWADALNKILHSDFQFDPYKPDEYNKFLERCLKRSKGSIDYQLRKAEKKLSEIEKTEAEAPTEEHFERVLLNLHEFSNWNFDNNEITTFQYCELVRRYTQHIQYLESQKTKNARR